MGSKHTHVFLSLYRELISPKHSELSTPSLEVLDSPDLQRLRVPTLDLVTDDEDAEAETVQESVACTRPLRWRRGILHPPAGSVVEMHLPAVSLEDPLCASMVDILDSCISIIMRKLVLQWSCTHACDFPSVFLATYSKFFHANLQEISRLPIYWEAHCAGHPCPNWATSFLTGFDWTSLRLEAFLAAVLQPASDPDPLVMSVTPSHTDSPEENVDATPPDMDIEMDPADDPAQAALERDLERWQHERDRTPSPPPSSSSAPGPQMEVTVSARLNRVFKWGNCSVHKSCSLQPHVLGPNAKEPGQIKLYCSKWFKVSDGGQRGCWFNVPFPRHRFSELGLVHKQKYQDLKLAMKRNARRPSTE